MAQKPVPRVEAGACRFTQQTSAVEILRWIQGLAECSFFLTEAICQVHGLCVLLLCLEGLGKTHLGVPLSHGGPKAKGPEKKGSVLIPIPGAGCMVL